MSLSTGELSGLGGKLLLMTATATKKTMRVLQTSSQKYWSGRRFWTCHFVRMWPFWFLRQSLCHLNTKQSWLHSSPLWERRMKVTWSLSEVCLILLFVYGVIRTLESILSEKWYLLAQTIIRYVNTELKSATLNSHYVYKFVKTNLSLSTASLQMLLLRYSFFLLSILYLLWILASCLNILKILHDNERSVLPL